MVFKAVWRGQIDLVHDIASAMTEISDVLIVK
jgi:hypothetical protein